MHYATWPSCGGGREIRTPKISCLQGRRSNQVVLDRQCVCRARGEIRTHNVRRHRPSFYRLNYSCQRVMGVSGIRTAMIDSGDRPDTRLPYTPTGRESEQADLNRHLAALQAERIAVTPCSVFGSGSGILTRENPGCNRTH